jgi:RHS repeat-associated protein
MAEMAVCPQVYLYTRWYNLQTAHFTQADTVVPNAGDAASYDRYTYARNNPVRYNDPSGHSVCNSCSGDYDMGGNGRSNGGTGSGSSGGSAGNSTSSVYPPVIESRSQWGAKGPGEIKRNEKNARHNETPYSFPDNQGGYMPLSIEHPGESLASIYTTIVIHHDGMGNIDSVQQLQLAQQSDGWWDITYHYIIDKAGKIYEGRQIDVRGAHVQDINTPNIGVLLLGDFTKEIPTTQQEQAATALVKWLDEKYGIDQVIGHNQVDQVFGTKSNNTDCPGANAYYLVKLLDELVR